MPDASAMKRQLGRAEGFEAAVCVIILNYNGWRYTVECLESLGHLEYGNWWVVVVDNGSTNDTVERLRATDKGKDRGRKPVQGARLEKTRAARRVGERVARRKPREGMIQWVWNGVGGVT